MLVTIRLFARLRELAGAAELQRNLPDGSTARSAWDSLVEEFPPLAAYGGTISCAVNEEYARLTTTLAEGDEVAFLPPVSGGASFTGDEESKGFEQEIRRSGALIFSLKFDS